MADLSKGYTIKTKGFKTLKVEEKLGEGGQGAVYKVEYGVDCPKTGGATQGSQMVFG
ncbi:MAG: hypothetical protein Ta2G_14300 [Termitinemataceae bacterium]|nr:MAG: hypothetical protein Ta2G_14300 [Termitinemataceae bacterium]